MDWARYLEAEILPARPKRVERKSRVTECDTSCTSRITMRISASLAAWGVLGLLPVANQLLVASDAFHYPGGRDWEHWKTVRAKSREHQNLVRNTLICTSCRKGFRGAYNSRDLITNSHVH